ncbi:MAG: hypothetical protein CVU74_06065 [Deltaproteobacteria bacterium HGW-Deltaproteobacteria-9]|nr:MAG: hypothetical protein CVU74_06065 [Deltaproteobacteria bacterium HGW-Deltaproteobacteria-9]
MVVLMEGIWLSADFSSVAEVSTLIAMPARKKHSSNEDIYLSYSVKNVYLQWYVKNGPTDL